MLYTRLFLHIVITIVLCTLFTSSSLLIAQHVYHIEGKHILMLISSSFSLIGVGFIFFINRNVRIICLSYLKLKKEALLQSLKTSLVVVVSFVGIVGISFLINLVEFKDVINIKFSLMIFYLLTAFFIALNEELIFRGLIALYLKYATGSKFAAIILSSLLFMLVHIQYNAILPFITALLAGNILALMTFRFESLYPAMAFHMCWNFSYFVFEDIFYAARIIPIWGDAFESIQIIFMFCVLIYLILYKTRKNNKLCTKKYY